MNKAVFSTIQKNKSSKLRYTSLFRNIDKLLYDESNSKGTHDSLHGSENNDTNEHYEDD